MYSLSSFIIFQEIQELWGKEKDLLQTGGSMQRIDTLRRKASLARMLSMRLSKRDLLAPPTTPTNTPATTRVDMSKRRPLMTSYDASAAAESLYSPELGNSTASISTSSKSAAVKPVKPKREVAFSAPHAESALDARDTVIDINNGDVGAAARAPAGPMERTPLLRKPHWKGIFSSKEKRSSWNDGKRASVQIPQRDPSRMCTI